jgi:YtcA family
MSPDAAQAPIRVAGQGTLPAAFLLPALLSLSGCGAAGAPSYDLFGAFFPAWLLCGIIGIAGAAVARAAFVSSGLANTLPYQLAVCAAIGVITALLVWLAGFGH